MVGEHLSDPIFPLWQLRAIHSHGPQRLIAGTDKIVNHGFILLASAKRLDLDEPHLARSCENQRSISLPIEPTPPLPLEITAVVSLGQVTYALVSASVSPESNSTT